MKKLLSIWIVLLLLVSLAACGKDAGESAAVPTVAPTPAGESAPTAPPAEIVITPTQTPRPEWAEKYRAYLNVHFEGLSQACYGFIAGVGFIDLDLDNVPEMLLFDAGASSSMGVQFFDLIEGQVECVSASSVEVGEGFGGDYYAPGLYVNTTAFQAFRLKEAPDGTLYFSVTSFNGSEDVRYSELIRFLNRDGVLALETRACEQSALNGETQSVLYTVYTRGDEPISEEEYNAILAAENAAADLGYEGAGAFIWENTAYGQDWTGFAAMFDAAAAAYVPAL